VQMIESNIMPRGVSIDSAMAQLSVSRATVNRLLASGQLRAVKCGAKTLILTESLDAYWRGLPAAQFRMPHQPAA
jgi:excisionase family DNA binding protein